MKLSSRTVDLNADMGESFGAWTMGDDAALLEVVTSANIACGFHAGDPLVMQRTCAMAASKQVMVGAHVSYRDLAGFGRSFLDVAPDQLRAELVYQLAAITGVAASVGARVGYVKPHGALYNTIVSHEAQAQAVVDAVVSINATLEHPLSILGLPGAKVLEIARDNGVVAVHEAFADRAYNADGTLVSRRLPGAVLHDADEVAARMVQLVTTGAITAIDGTEVVIEADSICVHGDSPGAVQMACSVRGALDAAGITLAPFVA